jgi:hypothetical protein
MTPDNTDLIAELRRAQQTLATIGHRQPESDLFGRAATALSQPAPVGEMGRDRLAEARQEIEDGARPKVGRFQLEPRRPEAWPDAPHCPICAEAGNAADHVPGVGCVHAEAPAPVVGSGLGDGERRGPELDPTTGAWPQELRDEVDALEEKWDIELVDQHHHARWVRACQKAEKRVAELEAAAPPSSRSPAPVVAPSPDIEPAEVEAVGTAIGDVLYEHATVNVRIWMSELTDEEADELALAAIRASRAYRGETCG